MVVISSGMPKSGSAYIYNLINEILILNGNKDARLIKEEYRLDDIMQWHNNNVGDLDRKILVRLLRISYKVGKFSIKTHAGPSAFHNLLLNFGQIKNIYIYRDPRDVLLSARDHGSQISGSGQNHTFAKLDDFDKAFESVKNWTKNYLRYKSLRKVLCIKYEDLMQNPILVLKKICEYLNVKVKDEDLIIIQKKYDKNNPEANMKGLHFNKGEINRYLNELSKSELERFKNEMGDVIQKMGYTL